MRFSPTLRHTSSPSGIDADPKALPPEREAKIQER